MSSRHWWILCAFFHRGEWEKINISEIIIFLGKSMWSRGMGKATTKESTEKSHKGWERRAYRTHLQCLEHLWKQRTARRRRPREAPWFEHSNKGWTPWLHVWFSWRFALWQTTCLLLCVSPGGDSLLRWGFSSFPAAGWEAGPAHGELLFPDPLGELMNTVAGRTQEYIGPFGFLLMMSTPYVLQN